MIDIYDVSDKEYFMKVVKIDKYKVCDLLDEIKDDNCEYGLIFRLCYIYGRLISEVYDLHEDDIDFSKNKIRFNINGSYRVYPLYIGLKSDLMRQVKSHTGFLFHHIYDDFDKFVKGLNYYLERYDGFCGVHISPKDFKKLRGQHLICDGVPIEVVQDLYSGRNISSTKRLLCYNELMGVRDIDSLDVVFRDFTL